MTPNRQRGAAVAAAAMSVAIACAGCSVGLEDYPLPAPGMGNDTYTLFATFANALNLPTKAKVRLGGADVGEVAEMRVRDYTAVVSLRIDQDVSLPVGTRAELRTATPLGDVFVSVVPAAGATADSPSLRDGDTIPLEATSAAATVEEVLTTAALLVNGGAIRNLTKVVNGMGAAVGERGDKLGALIDQTTELVRTLVARSEAIRTTLAETDRLAVLLNDRQRTIDEVIGAAGPALRTVADNTQQAMAVIQQIDGISRQMARFPSMQGTDTRSMIADINRVTFELNRAATDPNADFAAFNKILWPVLKLTNGTSAHVNVDLEQVALGAMTDPRHTADPGARLPDASDWQNFVGAFTYTMMRLYGRVTGPGR
ncbi:MlaD family protein [Nocardia arizonensis]|uniref:MlaD family protein n=1 Tax=Nocardia arizonensis TaxID=1141647 RepID=UPI0009E8EDD1|nr:MlaD family protein [Nocardia arizonensis]